MSKAVRFVNRQAVHVGAQPDALCAWLLSLDDADYARRGEAGVRLDAPFLQMLDDQRRGAALLEGELGMRVQVAADVAQLGVVAANPFNGTCHVGWMRSRGSTA